MIVEPQNSHFYLDDPVLFLDMQRFEKEAGDFVLIQGYGDWGQIDDVVARHPGQKLVFIDFEMPNFLQVNGLALKREWMDRHHFYKVLCVCPFTSEWRNKQYGVEKYIPIFHPINEHYIPPKVDKVYDVIYCGHIVAPEIENLVQIISKFNYRYVSHHGHEKNTNQNVSYKEKLALISQTRISVVNNLLYPNIHHLNGIKSLDGWRDNRAFSHVEQDNPIVPQLKSRLFEATLSRTLILCKRDPWNIIENYFIPNEEFLYYEDESSLEHTIRFILANYNDLYKDIPEKAYQKAIKNYTSFAFFNKFLKNLT